MCGPVAIGGAQSELDPAVGRAGEPGLRQWRPELVAEQRFEGGAVAGRQCRAGVEVEVVDVGSTWLLAGLDLGRERGEALDELAGAVAGGDAGSGGSACDGGEQGLVEGEGIEVGVGVEQAAGLEQLEHAVANHGTKDGDVLLLGQRGVVEGELAGGVPGEDAVKWAQMNMEIEVQGAAKTLNNRDHAGGRVGDALVASELAVVGPERVGEDGQDLEAELVAPGEQVADGVSFVRLRQRLRRMNDSGGPGRWG